MLDPNFCEKRCPICTNARKGNRLARILQRIEYVVTFGGCPWGRARQRKYGVRPDESLPAIDASTAVADDVAPGVSQKPPRKRRWVLYSLIGVLAAFAVVLAFVWWTMIQMPGASYRGALPKADEQLLLLAEELKQDVDHLAVKIGERNVSRHPKELAQAADWIEAEFVNAGYEVKRQPYEVPGCTCCNVEAERLGRSLPKQIVVVGAHYDSEVGTPGADDNASGLAAVLALARRFAKRNTDRTVRFVAFVNEESPYFQTELMGSWVYAKRCRERGEDITAMLTTEMIGYYTDTPGSQNYPAPLNLLYPSTGNFIAFVGDVRSARLVRQAIGVFRQNELFPSEGGAPPSDVPGVGFSDHWSFWQEGYPGIMVTDTAMFRYSQYHEPGDTPDKLDFERMGRVVRGLEKVVESLASSSQKSE